MLIAIDERDPRPIYLQIVAGIKEQIRLGQLSPGEGLPSVRELSEALGVNIHTVHRAYQKLRDSGVIVLRLGQRARVAARAAPARAEEVEELLAPRVRELVAEAFHLGITPDDLRALVDAVLQETKGA